MLKRMWTKTESRTFTLLRTDLDSAPPLFPAHATLISLRIKYSLGLFMLKERGFYGKRMQQH